MKEQMKFFKNKLKNGQVNETLPKIDVSIPTEHTRKRSEELIIRTQVLHQKKTTNILIPHSIARGSSLRSLHVSLFFMFRLSLSCSPLQIHPPKCNRKTSSVLETRGRWYQASGPPSPLPNRDSVALRIPAGSLEMGQRYG